MFLWLNGGDERAPLTDAQRWKYTRVFIAQHFPGWSLEYIDQLSYADRANIFAVLNAQALRDKQLRSR